MYEFAVTPAVTGIRRRGSKSQKSNQRASVQKWISSPVIASSVNGRVVRDISTSTRPVTELIPEIRKEW
jgi:hypothetical protein